MGPKCFSVIMCLVFLALFGKPLHASNSLPTESVTTITTLSQKSSDHDTGLPAQSFSLSSTANNANRNVTHVEDDQSKMSTFENSNVIESSTVPNADSEVISSDQAAVSSSAIYNRTSSQQFSQTVSTSEMTGKSSHDPDFSTSVGQYMNLVVEPNTTDDVTSPPFSNAVHYEETFPKRMESEKIDSPSDIIVTNDFHNDSNKLHQFQEEPNENTTNSFNENSTSIELEENQMQQIISQRNKSFSSDEKQPVNLFETNAAARSRNAIAIPLLQFGGQRFIQFGVVRTHSGPQLLKNHILTKVVDVDDDHLKNTNDTVSNLIQSPGTKTHACVEYPTDEPPPTSTIDKNLTRFEVKSLDQVNETTTGSHQYHSVTYSKTMAVPSTFEEVPLSDSSGTFSEGRFRNDKARQKKRNVAKPKAVPATLLASGFEFRRLLKKKFISNSLLPRTLAEARATESSKHQSSDSEHRQPVLTTNAISASDNQLLLKPKIAKTEMKPNDDFLQNVLRNFGVQVEVVLGSNTTNATTDNVMPEAVTVMTSSTPAPVVTVDGESFTLDEPSTTFDKSGSFRQNFKMFEDKLSLPAAERSKNTVNAKRLDVNSLSRRERERDLKSSTKSSRQGFEVPALSSTQAASASAQNPPTETFTIDLNKIREKNRDRNQPNGDSVELTPGKVYIHDQESGRFEEAPDEDGVLTKNLEARKKYEDDFVKNILQNFGIQLDPKLGNGESKFVSSILPTGVKDEQKYPTATAVRTQLKAVQTSKPDLLTPTDPTNKPPAQAENSASYQITNSHSQFAKLANLANANSKTSSQETLPPLATTATIPAIPMKNDIKNVYSPTLLPVQRDNDVSYHSVNLDDRRQRSSLHEAVRYPFSNEAIRITSAPNLAGLQTPAQKIPAGENGYRLPAGIAGTAGSAGVAGTAGTAGVAGVQQLQRPLIQSANYNQLYEEKYQVLPPQSQVVVVQRFTPSFAEQVSVEENDNGQSKAQKHNILQMNSHETKEPSQKSTYNSEISPQNEHLTSDPQSQLHGQRTQQPPKTPNINSQLYSLMRTTNPSLPGFSEDAIHARSLSENYRPSLAEAHVTNYSQLNAQTQATNEQVEAEISINAQQSRSALLENQPFRNRQFSIVQQYGQVPIISIGKLEQPLAQQQRPIHDSIEQTRPDARIVVHQTPNRVKEQQQQQLNKKQIQLLLLTSEQPQVVAKQSTKYSNTPLLDEEQHTKRQTTSEFSQNAHHEEAANVFKQQLFRIEHPPYEILPPADEKAFIATHVASLRNIQLGTVPDPRSDAERNQQIEVPPQQQAYQRLVPTKTIHQQSGRIVPQTKNLLRASHRVASFPGLNQAIVDPSFAVENSKIPREISRYDVRNKHFGRQSSDFTANGPFRPLPPQTVSQSAVNPFGGFQVTQLLSSEGHSRASGFQPDSNGLPLNVFSQSFNPTVGTSSAFRINFGYRDRDNLPSVSSYLNSKTYENIFAQIPDSQHFVKLTNLRPDTEKDLNNQRNLALGSLSHLLSNVDLRNSGPNEFSGFLKRASKKKSR